MPKKCPSQILGLLVVASSIFALGTSASAGVKNKRLLHSFTCGNDGGYPVAGLTLDTGGNLYGTAAAGGVRGKGVVFELMPSPDGTWKKKVLHSFAGGHKDLGEPLGGVVIDGNGNLFGTGSGEGPLNGGGVFELSPAPDGRWNGTILYAFESYGQQGSSPHGTLALDSAGNLYGTTFLGGNQSCSYPSGCGVLFRLAPSEQGAWTETVLHAFTGSTDGKYPVGTPALDPLGTVYGTTNAGGDLSLCQGSGCGVVFRLASNDGKTWAETVLHTFSGGADGANPLAGLTFDSAGSLFGTTANGGDLSCPLGYGFGCGVVFELDPAERGGTMRSFSFDGDNGASPWAEVTFDSVGNLYGTTEDGGGGSCGNGAGCGVLFEIKGNAGLKYQYIASPSEEIGFFSQGRLVLDSAGNVYGTTSEGGAYDCGTVFEITP